MFRLMKEPTGHSNSRQLRFEIRDRLLKKLANLINTQANRELQPARNGSARIQAAKIHVTLLSGILAASMLTAATCAEETPTSADDPRVDEILTRLEQARNDMKDIRANVTFIEEDAIELSKRKKQGQIRFLMTDPNPLFMIHFDKVETDGVVGKREWYLFDGRWMFEVVERLEQVTKREIAKADEKLDFFDLEKSPFPLPFGQRKEVILRSFEVDYAEPKPNDPPETDHLICVPRPGSRLAERYDKLDYYVLRGVNLPGRVVITRNKGREVKSADFPGLRKESINTGLTSKDFSPQPEWKKYKEVVEELSSDEK